MIHNKYTISYNREQKNKKHINFRAIPYTPLAHRVFWAVCLILVGLYGFFIANSIRNGIAAEHQQEALSQIKTDMLNLEYSYMSLANTIDLREAYARGFVDSKNPIFVDAGALPTLSLSR